MQFRGLPPVRTWLQLAVLVPVLVLAGSWWGDLLGAGDEGAFAALGLAIPLAALGVVLGLVHWRIASSTVSRWAVWVQPRFALIAWTAVGLVVTAWGAANSWIGQATREPHVVLVADVEAGQPLPGRWLDLAGRLVTEERVICDGPATPETYVPLVSDDWHPGQPIFIFVRAREEDWGAPGRLLTHTGLSVSGVLDPHGLRDDVRERFDLLERPAVADALVLDFEAKPAPRVVLGYAGGAIGLLILVSATIGWLLRTPAPLAA